MTTSEARHDVRHDGDHDQASAALPMAEPHRCNCGADTGEVPKLIAVELPAAIRHAAIIGALDSLAPGSQLDLVAPHEPRPLLAQIEQAYPGVFSREVMDDNPQAFHIRFTRQQ